MPSITCATCDAVFHARASAIARGKRFCSIPCRARSEDVKAQLRASASTRDISGDRNPNWKGGLVRGVNGRMLVYCPGDPEAKHLGGSHALRYRIIAREKLGRPLRPDEVVHHVNGDPTDDRPGNLAVMTQQEHTALHASDHRDIVTGRFTEQPARRTR